MARSFIVFECCFGGVAPFARPVGAYFNRAPLVHRRGQPGVASSRRKFPTLACDRTTGGHSTHTHSRAAHQRRHVLTWTSCSCSCTSASPRWCSSSEPLVWCAAVLVCVLVVWWAVCLSRLVLPTAPSLSVVVGTGLATERVTPECGAPRLGSGRGSTASVRVGASALTS